MKSFNDIKLFVQCAESGSITTAARMLDMTPAAASAALKRLEQEIGAQLLVRSTRSMRLTTEGERFIGYCREALKAIDNGKFSLHRDDVRLQGSLQLSAPSDVGRHFILDWLSDFQNQHPQLMVRLNVTDSFTDMYKHPVDAAIRYGKLVDSSLIATPLDAEGRRFLCASPAYLSRYGVPYHPQELSLHKCLRFTIRGEIHDRWHFYSGDESVMVRVSGNLVSDDGDIVRRWALKGLGIAFKSWLDIAADVNAGRLVILCPQWQGEPSPLNLVYASRHSLNPALKKLRDHLAAHCAAVPPPPLMHL